MTHDEMIKAVARAIYGERDFEGLGSDVTEQMFAVARAAIRVIAPAVLGSANVPCKKCGFMRDLAD